MPEGANYISLVFLLLRINYFYSMNLLPNYLLYLLHPAPGEEGGILFRKDVEALAGGKGILFSLHHNGLLSLFRRALLETESLGLFPEPMQLEMNQLIRKQTMRNLKLQAVLLKVHDILGEAGIPFLVIKGFAVAQEYYEDVSMRPMIDIDILIRPEDSSTVRQLLRKAGGVQFNVPQTEFFASLASHDPAILIDGVLIEPHTVLIKGSKNLGLEQAGVQYFPVAGKIFAKPFLPEHLLFLMNHVYKHLPKERFKLLWLRDTASMMRQLFNAGQSDEDGFFGLAEEYGCLGPVMEIAGLLSALLPDLLVRPISRPLPLPSEQAAHALQVIAEYGIIGRNDPAPKIRYFSKLNGVRAKVLFLAGILFPSPSYMRNRYQTFPPGAVFLLYPYHVVRVSLKGTGMIVRFFFRRFF